MTNATKTLAIVFAGTLVLALASTWGGNSASSAAFEQQLLAIDTAQVQAVQVDRFDAPSIRLERSNGTWTVVPTDTSTTYPASSQAVQGMLETFSSLEVGAVATRQSDKHPRYGVDSTGVRVTMLGPNDTALGELIVGRTQMQNPPSGGQSQNPLQRMKQKRRQRTILTYVRSPNTPDVYSVEQSLRPVATRGVEDWREKTIWSIDRSQIQDIKFSYPADSSFTVRRVVEQDTTAGGAASSGTWMSGRDTLATGETSTLLRALSSPDADGFAENLTPETAGDTLYTVRLRLTDGTQRALRFHPAATDDNYLLTADGYPYVARVRASRWERSVLQGRSAFLKNN